jgi:maltose-binding protein MalE
MQNTYLNYFLAALLILAPVAGTAVAAPQRQRTSAENVKIKVAKLGTGSKAKATIWLTNGTKVKGYVSQAGENDFVMRDRKTDVPTTISYADVTKFERNNGHSTAKWVGLGVGVGAGAFLLIVLASIAALD